MIADMQLKEIFTEKDNNTLCTIRICFIAGFIIAAVLTAVDTISHGVAFISSAKDWLSGMAEYLGLGGAAIAGKNFTESK